MTIKRMLLGAVAAAGLAGPAVGQSAGSEDVPNPSWFARGGQAVLPPTMPAPVPPGGVPTYPGPSPAPAPTAPGGPTTGPAFVAPPAGTPSSTGVLTAPPGMPSPAAHPPGTVTSPWCPGGNGCCGPTGRDGPLTYEVYTWTGPSIVFGGELAKRLNVGWEVAGGTRVMHFNAAGDAAWAIDLGLSYTYNRGSVSDFLDVNTPSQVPLRNASGGLVPAQNGVTPDINVPGTFQTTRGPDVPVTSRIRAVHRTNFNFGIGRDVFFNGPGFLSSGNGSPNTRVGADIGGRWGTAHVDLVPLVDDTQYTRRSGITHSIYGAVHGNWERPMGAWILLLGFRAEYDFTWANFVPPRDGNIHGVNLLLTSGIRF